MVGIRGMEEGLNDVRIVTYGPVLLPHIMTASMMFLPQTLCRETPRDPAFPVELSRQPRDA